MNLDRAAAEVPAYQITEAARYLGIAPTTLNSWVRPVTFQTKNGKTRSPIIERPQGSKKLSFLNLVEAFVVKALRRSHPQVPLVEIRTAIDYTKQELGIERVLVDQQLRYAGGSVFLDKVSELINIGRSGQLAVKKLVDEHLERIDFDELGPITLYPFVPYTKKKVVSISPYLSFGKPVVSTHRISTYMLVNRYDLGESCPELAKDYGITEKEVEQAILYERAA